MKTQAPGADAADERESGDAYTSDGHPASGDASLVPVRFEIPPELKVRLDALAAARGMTYSEIIREALRAFFAAEERFP
jgi:hypothetical protein